MAVAVAERWWRRKKLFDAITNPMIQPSGQKRNREKNIGFDKNDGPTAPTDPRTYLEPLQLQRDARTSLNAE